MKIYFAGSIRGGRDEADNYLKIIDHLTQYGEVLTEHVGLKNIEKNDQKNTDSYIFQRDISWLKTSDLMIADVTVPSLGVGYEIGFAERLNIPILCIYNPNSTKSLSAMVLGNKTFTCRNYNNVTEAKLLIDKFISSI